MLNKFLLNKSAYLIINPPLALTTNDQNLSTGRFIPISPNDIAKINMHFYSIYAESHKQSYNDQYVNILNYIKTSMHQILF